MHPYPPIPPIRIQLATLADIDTVAPLFDAYRQFYEQSPNLPLATSYLQERLQKHESVILLARNGAQDVLGFCQLYPSFCSLVAQPIYALYDLYVKPLARRSGIALTLLQAAERLAIEQGKVRLDLTTAKTNTSAQAVYESLGWQRDEIYFAYSKEVLT